jgi:hypothetical protein
MLDGFHAAHTFVEAGLAPARRRASVRRFT